MSAPLDTAGRFAIAKNVQKLPPYIFARIDEIKRAELAKGRKLISLGIGDPDLPTPPFILEAIERGARNPANHQYPSYWGMIEFRRAAARFLERRFGVGVKPESEVLTLIGSKEGIAHLPLAFVNPGEGVLVPDPGYPVYASAVHLVGGVPLPFALREQNGFLPDFAELEAIVKRGPRVRMMYLNYPNNPTSAPATAEFFREVVAFARRHDLLVCHDNAYSEIYFDGKRQPSFLEAPGAMEVGCEFHSLSKTFNMAGCRVGFVAGNEKLIAGLAQVKTIIDSGAYNAVQEAGIAALDHQEPFCSELRAIYQRRRDILIPALQKAGLRVRAPEATFYAWCGLPEGTDSMSYVMDLIQRKGIVATPGVGFGATGEGYVRFTLCSDESVLRQAAAILQG